MELELLAKDPDSKIDGCPSVYRGENGYAVVQGNVLDDATNANLHNVLPGETAVSIKMEVLRAALDRLA